MEPTKIKKKKFNISSPDFDMFWNPDMTKVSEVTCEYMSYSLADVLKVVTVALYLIFE